MIERTINEKLEQAASREVPFPKEKTWVRGLSTGRLGTLERWYIPGSVAVINWIPGGQQKVGRRNFVILEGYEARG